MTKLCKNHGNNGLVDGAQNIVCDGNPCIARLDADKCCKPDALCGSMNAIKIQKVCGVSGQLIAAKDTTSCGGLECSSADKVVCCLDKLPCSSVVSEETFCQAKGGNGLGNGLIDAASTTLCQGIPCTADADAATCCKS